jgi:cation:H+ antiporter
MAVNLPIAIGLFFMAAVVIVVAATFLTTAADVIASRMGLGRLWVGSLLLAGATSLPELATAVAAAMAGSAELAAGNMFGANMLNMSNLAILLALLGGRQVFQRLAPQQWLVAVSAIVVTGMATLFAAFRTDVTLLAVSIPGVVIIVTYIALSGVLRRYSKGVEEEAEEEYPSQSLRWAWMVFAACAAAIFVCGPVLAFTAQRIADLTGIGASFVGVLALALVTTLPELTTTFAALRMGAHDMAVANMYGTNSFNIAALAVADISFSGGSLFGSVDISTVGAGLIATLLMGLGTLQILRRRPMKRFSLTEPSPPLFVALYGVGLFVVFQLG